MHRRPTRASTPRGPMHRDRRTLGLAAAALLLACLASSGTAGAASLDDLQWLVGSWRGTIGDDRVEESWLPPVGAVMAGLFRWSKEGEVYLYELLSLEEAEGKVVLKVKHFGPGLVGWEDKAASVVFDLTEAGDGRAVFEKRGGGGGGARVVYRRTGERTMTASFEEKAEGQALLFEYERP